MSEIKTATETIAVCGDETWENLGEVTLYYYDQNTTKIDGTGTLLFKNVPGLGNRFKVVVGDKVYIPEKLTKSAEYNARIGALSRVLNIEGF